MLTTALSRLFVSAPFAWKAFCGQGKAAVTFRAWRQILKSKPGEQLHSSQLWNQSILLFGCLKGNFASTSYALCSKGLGGLCVTWFSCSSTFRLAESTMTSYWCCGQPPSTLFGRVVSQMTMMFPFALELVFSGPFSADVNAHHRIFGLFGGASEPGFTICGRFVVSLCTVAEG